MTACAEAEPHSIDHFLGGKVTLVQPRSGHRAGLDAALLQALVPLDATGSAVDLGSGAGTVALSVAARVHGLQVTGVEINPDLVACARRALRHRGNSRFAERVRFLEQDVTARRNLREAAGLVDGSADWVLMNPPFDLASGVTASPDPDRRFAHVGEPATLADWCRTASGLLKAGGRLGLIHRAAALDAVLQALKGRFGDCRIAPVHPGPDAAASRILVLATRASRAGLRLVPGLLLHGEGGRWTEEADLILRGERAFAL